MPSLQLVLSASIAVLLGVFAVIHAVRAARIVAGADGSALPSTPLERVARTSLIGTIAFVGPGLGVLLSGGIDRWDASAGLRVLVSTLSLAGIAAGTLPVLLTRRAATRGDVVLDERDAAVLHRAPEVQSWTLLGCVLLWTVLLQERFAGAGAVPLAWISVAFWTSLVAWALAMPLGIVVGYRRG